MWNRWRSEDGSRFISEDPIQDGINYYAYAGNSPLCFTDPLGLDVGDPSPEDSGYTTGPTSVSAPDPNKFGGPGGGQDSASTPAAPTTPDDSNTTGKKKAANSADGNAPTAPTLGPVSHPSISPSGIQGNKPADTPTQGSGPTASPATPPTSPTSPSPALGRNGGGNRDIVNSCGLEI